MKIRKKKTNVWNYDDKSHLRVLNYAISIDCVNFAHLLHISNISIYLNKIRYIIHPFYFIISSLFTFIKK